MSEPSKPNNHIQSVDRALAILEYLAEHGESSVTDIAQTLEIHKSTAFRLLATLERRGFVTQEENRGKYRLGLSLVHLAGSVTEHSEIIRLSRPISETLSQETEETVNIAVLDKDGILNIDQVIGSSTVVSYNWVGRRDPINCTATGKVLLAFSDDPQQQMLERHGFRDCTRYSQISMTSLEPELNQIKAQGYAYTFEELELGLNAVSAPIFNQSSVVIAGLCVSGPSYRLTQERIARVGQTTKVAALQISEKLGFRAY